MESEDIEKLLKEHWAKLKLERNRLATASIGIQTFLDETGSDESFVDAGTCDKSAQSCCGNNKSFESARENQTPVDHGNPFRVYDEMVQQQQKSHPSACKSNKTDENNKENLMEINKQSKGTATENRTNNSKIQENKDDMEPWASETFYTYFPSLNKKNEEKKLQLRVQQQAEYQNYLKVTPKRTKIPHHLTSERQTLSVVTNNNSPSYNPQQLSPRIVAQTTQISPVPSFRNVEPITTSNIHSPYGPDVSPRQATASRLRNLEHTDLTDILNSDTIAERNRIAIEEEKQKKMNLKAELTKQIEEKRLELERIKQQRKFEEEIIAQKAEEQMQVLALKEELERVQLDVERERLIRRDAINAHAYRNRLGLYGNQNPYDERKTQSENGKDKFLHGGVGGNQHKSNEKIYKFFSNSAQTTSTNRYDRYRRAENIELPELNRNLSNIYCKNCLEKIESSPSERYEMSPHQPKSTRSNPTTTNNHHFQSNSLFPRNPNHNMNLPLEELTEISYSEFDLPSTLEPLIVRRDNKPYSLNIDNDSIFSPNSKIAKSKITVNVQNGQGFVDQIIEPKLGRDTLTPRPPDVQLEKFKSTYGDLRLKRRSSSDLDTLNNQTYMLQYPNSRAGGGPFLSTSSMMTGRSHESNNNNNYTTKTKVVTMKPTVDVTTRNFLDVPKFSTRDRRKPVVPAFTQTGMFSRQLGLEKSKGERKSERGD